MKYLNHKRIKIICMSLGVVNTGYFILLYLFFDTHKTDFYLGVIFSFLIFLFYFLATTYFVYINDQMANFRYRQDTIELEFRTKLNSIINEQRQVINNLRNGKIELDKSQKEHLESTLNFLSTKFNTLDKLQADYKLNLDLKVSSLIARFEQFREKLLAIVKGTPDEVFLNSHFNFINDKLNNLEKVTPDKEYIKGHFNFINSKLNSLDKVTSDREYIKGLFDLINAKIDGKDKVTASKKYIKGHFDFINQKLNLESKTQHNSTKELEFLINSNYERLDALLSIHNALCIDKPLPIMSNWTLSSDTALYIVNRILRNSLEEIIDIGSGVSTLICGYALKKLGKGKVTSIEHDQYYYTKTKELIDYHQLEEFVNLHLCPLNEIELNNKKWLWYKIDGLQFNKAIDLVLVDGPPGNVQKLSRYPALPILKKYLSDSTVIILDDGLRTEEKEIADLWQKEFNLKSETIKSHKGIIELRCN